MQHTFRSVRLFWYAFASFMGLGVLFIIASYAFASSTGTVFPTADGTYSQWTPKSGTVHYTMVDESSCNGTTDYTSTMGVGNRDSYIVGSSTVPNGATITQIDIKPCASRVTSGGSNPVMNVFYRFGGINSADAGNYALTGTTPAEKATTTFSGLALIQTPTTTLEVGAVLTSGTKGARLSRIATSITYTPLFAPTNLTVASTGPTMVTISWDDNASTESGFAIERSLNGSNWAGIASTTASTTQYTDGDLSPNTTYYYRVRAFNSGGYSNYTNTATATTILTPPSAPSNFTATAATTTVSVITTWSNTATNATAIEVVRSTDGLNYAHIATTSASTTTYTDNTVMDVTAYYYKARAYNDAGYSAFSNIASATTSGSVPTTPSNFAAVASTTVPMVATSWTDTSSTETYFEVVRSENGGIDFSHVATTSANTQSYNDTTVASSTNYLYKVRAYNAYGYSAFSNVATATTATTPAAPQYALAYAASTTLTMYVYWGSMSGNETSFAVERSTSSPTTGFTSVATLPAPQISYIDTDIVMGATYYYRIFAVNGYGTSSPSSVASSTAPSTPEAPTNLWLDVYSGATTTVVLHWTDTSYTETAFEIERSIGTSTFSHYATTTPNTTTFSDYFWNSTDVGYRVRAFNVLGYSAFSNIATTTTP